MPRPKACFSSKKLSALTLAFLAFVFPAHGAEEKELSATELSQVSVAKQLEKQDGDFSDLFVNLKENPSFRYLSRKHSLDDPAVWPTLRKRFILNIADLQGQLADAESMIAARDARGGLNKQVISAEKTREKGRLLKAKLDRQIDEMRQMLRLIEEFQVLFSKMDDDQSLTGEIKIENRAGKSLTAQVLFIDGNDLIIERQNVGYFRIPAKLLSDDTKLEIFENVYEPWQGLPELGQDPETKDKNAGELIAYSGTHLYIDDRFEGFVAVPRSESKFIFTPYQERIESFVEEAADKDESRKRDDDEEQELISELREARELNQSRIDAIEWYQSRLGIELPESEREEAKAYLEENYAESEEDASEGKADEDEDEAVD